MTTAPTSPRSPSLRKCIVPMYVLAIALLAYMVMDYRPCAGKEAVLVKNWHAHGFFELQGRYVLNPGGVEPGEAIRAHRGHVGYTMLPHLIALHLTGEWAVAYMLAFAALVLVSFLALRRVLGAGPLAEVSAFAALTAPSVLRALLEMDPLTYSFFYSAALAPMAMRCLAGRDTKWTRVCALSLLLLCVVGNWTAIFALAPWGVLALCLARRRPWARTAAALLLVAGVSGVLLAAWMLLDKHGAKAILSPTRVFGSYVGGARGGYGGSRFSLWSGLARHVLASGVGLLPLWGVWLCVSWASVRRSAENLIPAVVPVAAAAGMLLTMFKYFASHPWIVSLITLNGLLAALFGLLAVSKAKSHSLVAPRPCRLAALSVLSAGYTLLLSALFHVNQAGMIAMHHFIEANTGRDAIIFIAPTRAGSGWRPEHDTRGVASCWDRDTRRYDGTNLQSAVATGRPVFILATSTNVPGAQRAQHDGSSPRGILGHVLARYRGSRVSLRTSAGYLAWDRKYRLFEVQDALRTSTPR